MTPAPTGRGGQHADGTADPVPVIEHTVNVPVFVDGLHLADVDRHGLAHLVFTAEQREATSGTLERVVAARLTLPAAVLAEVAARMLAAVGSPAPASPPVARSGRPLN